MHGSETRCEWCLGDPVYQQYHDEVWGVPQFDDGVLFEFLLLEGAQAGLSWITILKRRDNYRRAFDNFDAEVIARYDDKKKHALLSDTGIIRNRLKIDSAIKNARCFLELQSGPGFTNYLWQFVDGQPLQNNFRSHTDIPASTDVSVDMSRALKKLGFNFVGPRICYAFMQATGMVNDHVENCYRHSDCLALASRLKG